MADSKLNYSVVNATPLRFFKRNPCVSKSGGAATATAGSPSYKWVIYDFSGSMTIMSQRQLEALEASGEKIMIMAFGQMDLLKGGRRDISNDPWRSWLEGNGNRWVDLKELMRVRREITDPDRIARTQWRTVPTMFPWGTYTHRIEVALRNLPTTGVSIDLIFVGDGAFSDRNFIDIMNKASINGWLTKVGSFTFMGAHNIQSGTKRSLDAELQGVLTTSRSAIAWKSITLTTACSDLTNQIQQIKSSGITVPNGWLFFDASDGNPQLFHSKLTPHSISIILLKNQALILDYVDYLVRVFKNTPIVFTRDDNITSKIFQALKFFKGFENDKFNIQRGLFDRFSRANTTATHKAAFKILRTSDDSAEKLFIEQMNSSFSGEFYHIVATDGSCPFTSTEVDEALRDMSFGRFIKLLDNSFSEASTDKIVQTSTGGFPIIADCDDWNKKAIKSMRMLPFLLGQDGRLIGGNFMMVGAMYILTSEYITNDYLRRVAETFIFSDENKSKLRDLIYKSGSDDFQDNIYSATFARVIYHFCQVYRTEICDLSIDFSKIQGIYVALCKILLGRNFTYNISVTVNTYEFKVGDWVLINPSSWAETGKECPYTQMVNLARITESNQKERNYRRGTLRLRFLEGDSMDYTYVPINFLTKLADAVDITPDITKTVRKFQRNMWLKWLHFPDRRDGSDDGKETRTDGTLITFTENLQAIMRMIDPRHSLETLPKKLITKQLLVPKGIISHIIGFGGNGFIRPGKITQAMIEETRANLDTLADFIGLVSTIPIADRTINGAYGIFNHIIDESDLENISNEFARCLNIKCAGYECACGCEAIIRPGVVFENPGCGHHYFPKCLATYKTSCVQDPMDIRFDVSTCPQGCPGCISPIVLLADHTVIPTASLDDSVVNASATNTIGRCQSCCDIFVRGPRNCATSHTLPTQCSVCLPKHFWQCPGHHSDGKRCTVMTEHGGGCRMMQCCPVRNGWDDPCEDGCSHTLTHTLKTGEEVPIAIGCGYRYKMKDGLVQEDGTAESDGSHFY